MSQENSMSEHVSVETGRALHQAGWRRDWQAGDWVWVEQPRRGIALVVYVPVASSLNDSMLEISFVEMRESAHVFVRDCIHLPTQGQLVAYLAARAGVVDTSIRTARIAAFCGDQKRTSVFAHKGAKTFAGSENDLTEAAAQAVLAMLKQEKGREGEQP